MRAERALRAVGPAAAACWALAAFLALSFVSWWLVLLALLLAILACPAALRARRRRLRLRRVAAGGPAAAEAGWSELLDASLDRSVGVDRHQSVRRMSTALAEAHAFGEQARSRLGLIVAALERDWYAPDAGLVPESGLTEAVRGSVDALRPLRATQRLWPRSVLPWSRPTEQAEAR